MSERKYACDFYAVWARGTALYVKWAADHGISYTELSVLYALSVREITTQKAICDFYGLPKQTVSHCIQCLERKKYVCLEANRQDKRGKNVILTDIGQKYVQDTLAPLFQIEEYICRNISPERFVKAIETKELFNTLFEKQMILSDAGRRKSETLLHLPCDTMPSPSFES